MSWPSEDPIASGRSDAAIPRVFLSYRRDDTMPYALLIYDALRARFGKSVFMDIDSLAPGVDFVAAIDQMLDSCDVVLALIGPRWLTATDDTGRHRLHDEDDFVRLEIETALARDVLVVPVLVGGAHMPKRDEIPPSLAPLTRRQAVRLSDRRWRAEFAELATYLERVSTSPSLSPPPPQPPPPVSSQPRRGLRDGPGFPEPSSHGPKWVLPAAEKTIEVVPEPDLVGLRRAARHAGSPWVGAALAGFASQPLEQVAYALLCIDSAQFGEFTHAYAAREPTSTFAKGFSALATVLSGDLTGADAMFRAEEPGPSLSLLAAVKACRAGEHGEAGLLVEPWTKSLPDDLGPPTAAAALGLASEQGDDPVGGAYWSDLLQQMLPNSTGVMALRASCHGRMGDSAVALEQSRAALLAWPQNAAHRDRFLKWADAVGEPALNDADRALARTVRDERLYPGNPVRDADSAVPCACATTLYLDLRGDERIGSHFELLLTRPILAARCRATSAAWLFVKLRAGAYRAVRLANVRFSGPPVLSDAPIPPMFS